MGIYHAIPPADEALMCPDCHRKNSRMDWQALGYEGDPKTLKSQGAAAEDSQ
jgi:hypothetical protein